MDLRALQRFFQTHVLAGDPTIGSWVADDGRVSRSLRLAIYANAYTSRLVGALAENYPAVRFALGPDRFDIEARRFVADHPSSFPSIRDYGADFAASLPCQVDDLARWEWALAGAFDAGDAVPVDGAALSGLPPAEWPAIHLRFVPSLRVHRLQSNALAWWRAATAGDERPVDWQVLPASDWVVWRDGVTTSFRSLPPVEAGALEGALRGATFAALCATAATFLGEAAAPMAAATLLKTWLASGWIAGIERGAPAGAAG